MTWLQKIREEATDTSGRTNIVIVPGNNSETLADQTCSHFPSWLDDIVARKDKSTAIWIFRHDIRIDSITSWFAFCEAGEHLLQNLTSMQNDDGLSDDDTLILVGHKLGSFMLKKALLDAHRSSHHPHIDALLNTIETLVMLGDPDLNPGNQNEWISLISKCLPYKTLPKHLDCPEDARCLQHVAGCFEEFTLHSTIFQVSSAAESKRKRLLKFRSEDHRCIFSANMTVRMWTTTNEEFMIPHGEGDRKNCAFCPNSTLYNQLISIPDNAAQLSISGIPAPVAMLEAQTSGPPRTCSPMDEPTQDLTRNRPASPIASVLTTPPVPATDIVPLTTVALASGSEVISMSSVEDETNFMDLGDRYSDLGKTRPDSLPAVTTKEPENPPCHDFGSELAYSEQARHEDLDNRVPQQHIPDATSVREPLRVARRSPFLYMKVPGRDVKFFGREEILTSLQDVLTPKSLPTNDSLATLASGAIVVLHGAPGVGKSAIALELTYRTQAMFDHIFWLRASSSLHLAQSFHQAATSLGLVRDRGDHNHESSRQNFMDWLSTTCSKWLLVFDDADELQLLSDLMPRRLSGSIIVTSRQRPQIGLELGDGQCLHNFQVGPFVVGDAAEFIRALAPRAFRAADTARDVATLITIAENCGCLPLTLRRVGMIINRRASMRDRNIMGILEEHASRVLASQISSPFIYANLSSASRALISVIAFLDPYCIDDAILLGARRYRDVPLREFPMKDDDYFDAKNELIAHALLAVGTASKAIDIHRLTAEALRTKLGPEKFRESFESACRLIETRWPSRRKMKNIMLGNWPEFDSLHSHVHELTKIYVEYDRKPKTCEVGQEIFNDSYLKILLLSTWYNACRGNSKEDQVLIYVAHVLIARLQKPDRNLPKLETASTVLPPRLIDVGVNKIQSPRLVDTAGQSGCYVALSHCWSSRDSSEMRLTSSNMSRLQRNIESSEIPRSVSDAIDFTRSLGMRYLWIDALCVVEGDQEDLSRMSDIYRSAVVTILPTQISLAHPSVKEYLLDSSVLEQPFSIFLDWSRPALAMSCSDRLFSSNPSSRGWLLQEVTLTATAFFDLVANQVSESGNPHEDTVTRSGLDGAENVQPEVEINGTNFDEAGREIDHGVKCAEAGENFEALAFFMKAKELVSAFQTLTPKSWKLHAIASANIALVYQMQRLPVMALDIAEASLALQSRLSDGECKSSLELFQLHSVMAGIYNSLDKSNESLNHYKSASRVLEDLPDDQDSSVVANWKGVLDLKLAQHHLRTKEYKEAQALLQQSLDHFQSQETLSAQAHLARTLHWQSAVYEAQGSKVMGNAIKAAAREAWIGVREARGHAVSDRKNSLTTEDFDGEVGFGYR